MRVPHHETQWSWQTVLAAMTLMMPSALLADRFHDSLSRGYGGFRYGGAYCAIADDPSALFINPAGAAQQSASAGAEPQSLTTARSGHYRIRQRSESQDLSLSSVDEAFFAPTYLGGVISLGGRPFIYGLSILDYVKRQGRITEDVPQSRGERPEIKYRRDDQSIQAGMGTAWQFDNAATGLAVLIGFANYDTEILRKGRLSLEGFNSTTASALRWQESISQERLLTTTFRPGIMTSRGATSFGASADLTVVASGTRTTYNDNTAQPVGEARDVITSYSPAQPFRLTMGWAQRFGNWTVSNDVALRSSQEFLGEFESTRWTRPTGNISVGLGRGGKRPDYTVAAFTDLSSYPIDSDLDRLREDSIDMYGLVSTMRFVISNRAYISGLEVRYGRSMLDRMELLRSDTPIADKVVITAAIGSEGRVDE